MARRGPLAQRTLKRFTRLLQERRRCAAEVAEAFRIEAEEANATADISDRFDADNPVGAASEESFLLAERADEMVHQIDRALERIDAGTFGLCEDCGAPIPVARLQAVPTASSSLSCKQRHIAGMVSRARRRG